MTNYNRSIRDRTFFHQTEVIADSDNPSNNANVSQSPYGDFMKGEDLSGDDRPGWRSVIRSRGNALNSLVANRKTVKVGSTSFNSTTYRYRFEGSPPALIIYRTERFQGSGNSGESFPPDFGGGVPHPAAMNMAIARFVSNARSRMSPANGGTILGELRETLHMIRHPADALRHGLSRYLDTVKKRARGLKKASVSKKNAVVAQTWLEYSFGWKPLIHDITDSAQALAQLVTGVRPLDPIRASGTHDDTYVPEIDMGTIGRGIQSLAYKASAKRTTSAYLYGAIDTSVGNDIPSVSSAFGLRPHDILPTIWELIPYSFVADYFTNIGEIISCASFATRYLAWWGGTTVTEVESKTYGFYDVTSYPNVPFFVSSSGSCSGGGTVIKHRHTSRVLNPLLVPSISFKVPGSPNVGFNLAALFAQARAIRF